MIFKNLSVWIQYSDKEEKLVEYETNVVDEDVIECWIPSTEGREFGFAYQVLELKSDDIDLRCRLMMDGVEMKRAITTSKALKTKTKRSYRLISRRDTDSTTARMFSFGKRTLTDREDIAPSTKIQEDLNTICAILDWGKATKPKPRTFHPVKGNGPIHEKAAKKGHDGSAGLGRVITLGRRPGGMEYRFNRDPTIKPIKFVFRYGPEDWLQARGIIPSSSQVMKRERDATPELIDVDELDTDDDEITIVKHLIPAPVAPPREAKRQRVKREDEDHETEPASRQENINPKLES